MENIESVDKRIEHILISKTKMIYGIIVIMVPIVTFFFKIQLDVALIKQNHEAHMQTALEKIAALEENKIKQDERLEVQNKAIIELMLIHKKELGN
jgi:hypothetical protein